MSKQILFLYRDTSAKRELALCEEAVRAVLRKFRKTAVYSYMQLDSSPSCRSAMSASLLSCSQNSDAILECSKRQHLSEDISLLGECFGIFAAQHFLSGKCIISPFSLTETKSSGDKITYTQLISRSDVQKAASLAIACAKERKHSVTLCTDSCSEADKLLFTEFENSFGSVRHLDYTHYSFDEMIHCCIHELPLCDVLFTSADKAEVIKAHMCALHSYPSGLVIWHGRDGARIYRREFFAHEQTLTLPYASLVIACGSMLEKELGFQSAGAWLRRCATLALERCAAMDIAEFQNQLLFEINTPIRNRYC